jgi:hypothetical protein
MDIRVIPHEGSYRERILWAKFFGPKKKDEPHSAAEIFFGK